MGLGGAGWVKNFSVGICDGAPSTAHSSFYLHSYLGACVKENQENNWLKEKHPIYVAFNLIAERCDLAGPYVIDQHLFYCPVSRKNNEFKVPACV